MYGNKKILAVITARGGSKGLKGKNLRKAGGKPLIAWTIEAAQKSRYLDRVILSSDDRGIIAAAEKMGCEAPFVRPRSLAGDKTPGIDPVLHAIAAAGAGYDYAVLLQPTSPLRTAGDIDGCIRKCISGGHRSCVTVTMPEKSPYWMFSLTGKGVLKPLLRTNNMALRRQDLPDVYVLNGAVYAAECVWLMKNRTFLSNNTAAYVMPKDRSLDIDTAEDIVKMEYLLSLKRGRE